jgi:predicted nucleic acid-binding protein
MEQFKGRVYVDANIFLNAILYDPGENEEARRAIEFLDTIRKGAIHAMTSALTWDEFVWVLRKEMDETTAKAKGREFLSFPHLHFVDITASLVSKAQDILEQHGVKPRDAIHLATAVASGAGTFATFDSRLSGLGIIPCDDLASHASGLTLDR